MWQLSVLLFILLQYNLCPLRQRPGEILPRIVPLNNPCAITIDNQDMNHLHVLLRELYPLPGGWDTFKVFTIPKFRDHVASHSGIKCPTLRVQQGSNQKCYVRISLT